MGGILGAALLICVATMFYILGRWKSQRREFHRPTGGEQSVTEAKESTLGVIGATTGDSGTLSGRLWHPENEITASGRLQRHV